jgi:hypothetical protein
MGKKLVSGGLSLSILSLVGHERQLPCGDHWKEYVVHPDSGFAIHCTMLLEKPVNLAGSSFPAFMWGLTRIEQAGSAEVSRESHVIALGPLQPITHL